MHARDGVVVSSALPSLVTVQIAPLSASRKLAPEMPTSASKKQFCRNSRRALCDHRRNVVAVQPRMVMLPEQFRDFFAGVMQSGPDDVGGRITRKLNDMLGEIGLDSLDARLLQSVWQTDLLA